MLDTKLQIEKCPILNKNVTITVKYFYVNVDQELSPVFKDKKMIDCDNTSNCPVEIKRNNGTIDYDFELCPIAKIFNKNG